MISITRHCQQASFQLAVAWALKKKDVSHTFLWAGAWFYPIPICLGLLGLIGIALLSTSTRSSAVAPQQSVHT